MFVDTARKVERVNALSENGLAKIEVTAFVSPKAIPALRDADEPLRAIRRASGVICSALVPNVRGAERAVDAGVDELNLMMSASESHNLSNLRMSRAQSHAALSEVAHAPALMGYDTGIDLARLLAASASLPGLIGHDVPSQILKAGQRLDLHPRPHDFEKIAARAAACSQPCPVLAAPRRSSRLALRQALASHARRPRARGAKPTRMSSRTCREPRCTSRSCARQRAHVRPSAFLMMRSARGRS